MVLALARWLPNDTPDLHRRLVVRALTDAGICENPPGSNRSGVIDEYNRRAGVPEGSYWCASAVAAWHEDEHAAVPPAGRASVDTWIRWAQARGQWVSAPVPGAAVVYGVPGDGQHMGLVVRVSPLLLSVEGNTSLGGQFSRNGVAVDLKEVNRSRLLGYITPAAT